MSEAVRKPASVLLIDDDARLLDALKRHFHAHRHECVLTTSPDAREALRLAAQESFDVIVTDILMPALDGIEVLMELRRRHSTARIVAISGGGEHVGVDSLDCARLLGAHRTLRKPFPAQALVEVVLELAARAPDGPQTR